MIVDGAETFCSRLLKDKDQLLNRHKFKFLIKIVCCIKTKENWNDKMRKFKKFAIIKH